MTLEQIRNGKTDPLGHSSIQPWSAGAHFPGVIARVEEYADFPVGAFTGKPVELTFGRRLVRTGHRAIYKGEERMFWSTDEVDTYEAAAHWIACMKELDEEAKPYGRQADGIYQGELQAPAGDASLIAELRRTNGELVNALKDMLHSNCRHAPAYKARCAAELARLGVQS